MSMGGTIDTPIWIPLGPLGMSIGLFNAAMIASFTNGCAGDLAFDFHIME